MGATRDCAQPRKNHVEPLLLPGSLVPEHRTRLVLPTADHPPEPLPGRPRRRGHPGTVRMDGVPQGGAPGQYAQQTPPPMDPYAQQTWGQPAPGPAWGQPGEVEQIRSNSTIILVLGILGLVVIGPLGSIPAWIWGNSTVKRSQALGLPRTSTRTPTSARSSASSARSCGSSRGSSSSPSSSSRSSGPRPSIPPTATRRSSPPSPDP